MTLTNSQIDAASVDAPFGDNIILSTCDYGRTAVWLVEKSGVLSTLLWQSHTYVRSSRTGTIGVAQH